MSKAGTPLQAWRRTGKGRESSLPDTINESRRPGCYIKAILKAQLCCSKLRGEGAEIPNFRA